ncbi:helix-turn-helix domain-containing protein [Inhella gelatinilytica]|uniref:Helix-turn-helix transcriptional regulator n=1 Tax=Inhella gelatinilytica TaxID=2795030 RepID=A0A931ISE3_9BURK|nr:helix-turn-helix transcriptional regulator [Inhella gelatinilytica]MBH9551812.1 helix-turn-helix transcriptional regulator [Inhella gelatinilytica]
MSSTRDLIAALKSELKLAGITYAELAQHLGLAESSVKRMFASEGDLPLSRIDEVLRVLKMDFADLARRVADAQPLRHELSAAQEQAVVGDPKLLLMALCCLSQWSFDQIVGTYRLDEPEAIRYLAQLDRLGVIELRPLNRYRLLVSKTFRWRPGGPVMRFFRDHAAQEFFEADFDGEGERLLLVHGQLSPARMVAFNERLERVAQDFAQQHLTDQRLPPDQKRPYTMVVAARSWLFGPFASLRRQ